MDSHENKPQQSKNEQETARVVAEAIAKLQQFRQNLYNFFPHRADASMELIDAFLPRKLAEPLPDRTFVHCPNTIAGNKPVTIGHDYSVLSFLPEKASPRVPPWVVPLVVRRVKSTEKASQVGAEQITAVVTDEMLPFGGAA